LFDHAGQRHCLTAKGKPMSQNAKHMKLGLFVRPVGHHVASWRHPDAQADAGVNFGHFVDMAQTAERGLFDMMFSADSVTAWTTQEEGLHRMHYVAWIEPYSLLTALAAHTRHIGLVCTATTTYEEPYAIARKFASLDIISGGRAGWNLVTSGNASEAQNFGRESHLPKIERYRRAREFADVVTGLWDSWDEDAFPRNRESGVFFDRDKMHVLDHKGEYFRVRGPLNVARSPQGQPVLIQAGASEDGRQLAAETAQVVFTVHSSLASGRDFYADVKSRMAKYGRDPDHMKIMPGLSVTVGRTTDEAKEKYERLQDYIHPEVGLALLSRRIGYDLTRFPIDGPVPEVPKNDVISSRSDMLVGMAKRENLTIRQLYKRFAGARGHFEVVGTPAQIADQMQEWIEARAADGFNVMPPYFPGGLNEFVDLVIPELQRRGLFRTQYESKTLRGNLGIPHPVSRYVSRAPELVN
jgi:FMN-dependent oxidoreductase (nitrilotriacetate monooxygenase family)